jgi:hypothetical protein
MKILSYIVLVFLVAGALYSCEKDNYAPPGSQLSGALLYNGDTVYVEHNRVPFQLYQYGFGKVGAINGSFTQNGTMNTLLFDGDYKFIIPGGQGPFLWQQTSSGTPDTLDIPVTGSKTVDIEVTPFYMIRNAQISIGSGNVSATFKAEKIITDANAKDIESVTLFINKTQFVSGSDNIARADMAGTDIADVNNISLSVAVPSLTQHYVFARIGIKIAGVEDMIFSQLVQLTY